MCTDLYAGRAGRFQQSLVIEPGMKPRMIRDADTAEVMIRGDLVALKIARHRLEGFAEMDLAQGELARHGLMHGRGRGEQQPALLAVVAVDLFPLHRLLDGHEGIHQFAIDALRLIKTLGFP